MDTDVLKKSPFTPLRGEGKPLRNLPSDVARKIAAGEVIDRPNSILREFLDNAIDSGANRIIAEIKAGGIDSIRVVDNGCGMSREDLEQCAYPHATSKINSEIDLDNLSTLGFRGEALASIAAVSSLSIKTSRKNSGSWEMEASMGSKRIIKPSSLECGSIITSKSLFENIPARRQFLKRPATESSMCRQTFIEKAIPVPEIALKLVIDNKIRHDFPSGQTRKERFLSAIGLQKNNALFSEIQAWDRENKIPEWNIKIVLGDPSISRNDKKFMMIFVNGRRIQEYSLLQAIDYGSQGYFPNGTHPIAALFIEIQPHLVDFNIHPAKKEVRFKNQGPIHHAVSSTIRSFYKADIIHDLVRESSQDNREKNDKPIKKHYESKPFFYDSPTLQEKIISTKKNVSAFFSNDFSTPISQKPLDYTEEKKRSWHYIGQSLGVFLLVEKEEKLYLIDQHAGHERIRFDEFMECAGEKQKLLIPYILKTSNDEEDNYIKKLIPHLEKAGFDIKQDVENKWNVFSVPLKWKGTEKDLSDDILTKRIKPDEIIRSIGASFACRGAIKDGDIIDRCTAESLVDKIFSLQEKRCPHGRPIWTIISKEELFQRVNR